MNEIEKVLNRLPHTQLLPPTLDVLLSVREVAKRFGVTPRTIWRWLGDEFGFPRPCAEKFPFFIRWSLAELQPYLQDPELVGGRPRFGWLRLGPKVEGKPRARIYVRRPIQYQRWTEW